MASSLGPRGALWMDSFGLIERGLPRTPGNGRDWRAPHPPSPRFGRGCPPSLTNQAALGAAALHRPAAKQHRDAALDAHPKPLPLFEGPAALQGFLPRRLLSAALGDAYLAHAGRS